MAALIKDEIGVETDLIEGERGEFTIWVDDELVARKDARGFPSEQEMLAAVRKAVGRP